MPQTSTRPYLGLRVAYLPRNSTPRQEGNFSQRRQRYKIADHIEAGGGTPVPFDEGIASGRDLGKRPDALRALEAIENGQVDALAWEDISRVTRDEHGTDAGLISETLERRRALLVTLDRDYRLWRRQDLRDYKRETADSGDELLTIRDRLWGGVLEKATTEPFFMGVPPYGYTTTAETRPAGGRRGGTKLVRIPARDEACAPAMAAIAEAMDDCTALGEVAAWLNSLGHFRQAAYGELVGEPTRWRTEDLRRILEHPIYGGWWTLGRASDGSSSIWEGSSADANHGGRIPALRVEHLAWFTSEQLGVWREQYPRRGDKSGPRHRENFYPLRGVLACVSCGRTLVGRGQGRYRCAGHHQLYRDGRCPAPQTITEQGAVRALLEEVPRALAAIKDLRRQLGAAAAEDDELDALRRRRDVRIRQSEALLAQAYPDDWDGTPNPLITARLEQWKREVASLDVEIRNRERFLSTDPARRRLVEAVLRDPRGLMERMPARERFSLLRLTFADARIRATGWGTGRRYAVESYRNLMLDSAPEGGSAGTTTVYDTIRAYLEEPRG